MILLGRLNYERVYQLDAVQSPLNHMELYASFWHAQLELTASFAK